MLDKDERLSSSWWSSKHPDGALRKETLLHSRRITLLDLLLLVIIMGILVPWIFYMKESHELGPYRMTLNEHSRNGISVFVISVRLANRSIEDNGINQIGIAILDSSGRIIHESRDIPPAKGGKREFIFRDIEGHTDSIRIYTGTDSIVLHVDDE